MGPVRVRFVSGLRPVRVLLELAVPLRWWSSWLPWPGPWRRLRQEVMPLHRWLSHDLYSNPAPVLGNRRLAQWCSMQAGTGCHPRTVGGWASGI